MADSPMQSARQSLLACRCSMPCTEQATQEDMLCDVCRRGASLHMHVGQVGGQLGEPMSPLATSGPVVFK